MTIIKNNKLIKNKEKGGYLRAFLIAFAVAVAVFIPFIIYGKGIFYFYGDYNAQQIPFYIEEGYMQKNPADIIRFLTLAKTAKKDITNIIKKLKKNSLFLDEHSLLTESLLTNVGIMIDSYLNKIKNR